MNTVHRWYCRSDHWRRTVRGRLAPWVLDGVSFGEHALEIGPGPGLVTDVLRDRVPRLTVVEIDPKLASALETRLAGSNVTVVQGDATRMPFPAASFDGAVSCTMLHHVPSPALQDRLLAEVARVLRPGAWFGGSDSMSSTLFRLVHLRDTLVPVCPDGLPARLEAAGFTDVRVRRHGNAFRFRARRAV
jgi:ubiquinone/menaquinone biosynthesis C-methylase UbiE